MFPTNRQMRRHPEMFGITMYAPDGDGEEKGGSVGLMDKPAGADVSGETGDDDDTDTGAGDDADDEDADEGEDEGEDGEQPKPKPKTPTPTDDELVEARVAERLAEKQREAAAEKQREADEAADTAHKAKVTGLHETYETKLTETLDSIGVAIEDQTYRLDKGTRDAILADFKEYKDLVVDAEALRARDVWTNNVVALVPEAKRDETRKALDKAKSYAEFFKVAGEAYATQAEALGTMALDDLLALSPKAKREHLEAVKGIKKTARTQGQGDADAEPNINGDAPGKTKSYEELAAGYGAGTLTDAEDATYVKLLSEREARGG